MKRIHFILKIESLVELENLKSFIDVSLGFRNWEYDFQNSRTNFYVEVLNTSNSEIIDMFQNIGISCEYVETTLIEVNNSIHKIT